MCQAHGDKGSIRQSNRNRKGQDSCRRCYTLRTDVTVVSNLLKYVVGGGKGRTTSLSTQHVKVLIRATRKMKVRRWKVKGLNRLCNKLTSRIWR